MNTLTDHIQQHTTTIEAGLPKLTSERDRLLVRRGAVQRMGDRLRLVLDEEDEVSEIEQLDQAIAHHDAVVADITTCLSQLDREILKINNGVTEAFKLKPSSAKRAYLSYVANDIEHSLITVRMARLEYKEVFVRLKELSEFWI